MNVIGLDVGFSATRKSSGVAQLHRQVFRIERTSSSWTEQRAVLADGCIADVTAIDAPLLSKLTQVRRKCERVFTLGKFQKRCKPGMSHIQGTGMQLRRAGSKSADQFAQVTSGEQPDVGFPQVWPGRNLVEAFPNAFLGVTLEEICYESMPSLKRGKKFDWLYDQCRKRRSLEHITSMIRLDSDNKVLNAIESTSNHEKRAALVCLLTAASVAAGRYTAVGEPAGGFFFLPPWDAWAAWSREEIKKQCIREGGLEIWIDGESFDAANLQTKAA